MKRRNPDPVIAPLIMKLFPPEEENPGRWLRRSTIINQICREHGFERDDVWNTISTLWMTPWRELEFSCFQESRDAFLRPTTGALPWVTATQLGYLRRLWDLLDKQAWRSLNLVQLAESVMTQRGYNYLGMFRNKGLVAVDVQETSEGEEQKLYRRGVSVLVVYPGIRPENGQLWDLNADGPYDPNAAQTQAPS